MATRTQGTELWYQSSDTVMTKVGKITGVTGTGGGKTAIPATTLDDLIDERSIAGLGQPGAVSVPINFDPADPTHQSLLALNASGATVKWVIGLSNGTAPPTSSGGTITYPTTRTYRSFDGFVSDFPVDTSLNSKYETTLSVQRSGPISDHFKS
jgi:hypothetical protein